MLYKEYFLCLPRGLMGMNNERKGKFNRYTTWSGIQEQVIRSDNKGHSLNNRIPHITENSNCNTVSRTLLDFFFSNKKKTIGKKSRTVEQFIRTIQ